MFKITAKTNGRKDCTTAILSVKTDLPCNLSVFDFTFQTGQQYSAQLLVGHIRKEISSSLEEIRKAAYEQGRNDMKARRKKKTSFGSGWNSDYVGW